MALIKTTDELAKCIKIDANFKIVKMQSALDTAELDIISKLLGEAFYLELSDAYNAGPLTDPELQAVLPYVQKALAYYAAYLSVEEMGVSVGDLGIQQQFGQNTQPAPAWKVTQLRQRYLMTADKSADLLLEFLELSAVIPTGGSEADRHYKLWYEDPTANTSISGCIVYKTGIAGKYIDIGDSRRLFLRLKKRIREIEESAIMKIIGKDQYVALVDHLKTGESTDDEKALIAMLEPIIAKRALYAAIPTLPVIITADGLFLQTQAGLIADNVIQKLQASPGDKATVMKQLKEGDDIGYLSDEARLHDFLVANLANYPLVSASPAWQPDITKTNDVFKIDNFRNSKHFST